MRQLIDRLRYALRSPWLDLGAEDAAIVLAGMGRSGTTWVGDLINHDGRYRVLFEPFFPAEVEQARPFEYIQYMNPQNRDEALAAAARSILAGKPRGPWVDRDSRGVGYRERIIKDIRCNLMLGWLKQIAPALPIVLLIRHPLQVSVSWQRLGWGEAAHGGASDIDILMAQPALLRDFPVIEKAWQEVDREAFIERIVFEWCILHRVPLSQLRQGDAYVVFYERLLTQPEEEVRSLFEYLGRPFEVEVLSRGTARGSSTNFQGRDFVTDRKQLLDGWRDAVSKTQQERAEEILSIFGLSHLYPDGHPTKAPLLK